MNTSMLSHYESTPQQQNPNITNLTAIPVKYTDYKSHVSNTVERPMMPSHEDQVLPALINKAMNNNRGIKNQPAGSATELE
jgi:hypothetical protein